MRIEDLQDPSKPFATYYKGQFFISYKSDKSDNSFKAYYFNSYDELDWMSASHCSYDNDILLHKNMDTASNHAEIIKLLKELPKQFPELVV